VEAWWYAKAKAARPRLSPWRHPAQRMVIIMVGGMVEVAGFMLCQVACTLQTKLLMSVQFMGCVRVCLHVHHQAQTARRPSFKSEPRWPGCRSASRPSAPPQVPSAVSVQCPPPSNGTHWSLAGRWGTEVEMRRQ